MRRMGILGAARTRSSRAADDRIADPESLTRRRYQPCDGAGRNDYYGRGRGTRSGEYLVENRREYATREYLASA